MTDLALSDAQRDEAAKLLLDAYRTKNATDPLTERYPAITIDDAYDIQLRQVKSWTDSGEVIKGYKVGLTSAAMQRQLGVNQPDFGHLTGSMFHLEYQPIPMDIVLQPKIEPEVAFVLGTDLSGPGITVPEAIAAIDYVLPAIELIDSRIRDWKIGIQDTVADNASGAGLILGSNPRLIREVDLARSGCNLFRNGHLADSGAGGAVLGSPINSLVWLANTLGSRGITFSAGDVILPGSVTAALPVASKDVITAEFAGIGSVTALFG